MWLVCTGRQRTDFMESLENSPLLKVNRATAVFAGQEIGTRMIHNMRLLRIVDIFV